MEHFKNQKIIHRRYVARLLIACKNHFEPLSSLMEISLPPKGPSEDETPRVTVCGDTHGQFYEYAMQCMNNMVNAHIPVN